MRILLHSMGLKTETAFWQQNTKQESQRGLATSLPLYDFGGTALLCFFFHVFQVDEGGIKALLADSWTTFMKARVMCGAGNTQQQYNNMKQAVVVTDQDKREGVMYGLFSNAW